MRQQPSPNVTETDIVINIYFLFIQLVANPPTGEIARQASELIQRSV